MSMNKRIKTFYIISLERHLQESLFFLRERKPAHETDRGGRRERECEQHRVQRGLHSMTLGS